MPEENSKQHIAAVVGAGPAGLFASKQLTGEGVRVVLFNRDIKPGGLAEYGIYPDKYKMKEGLRRQFYQILESPLLDYYGNVTVGQTVTANGGLPFGQWGSDITLAGLRALGFQAILITAGAQGTKWLGLPGEHLLGVYHAKDLVYHYNQLPPFSDKKFHIGKKVALIGVGNVMMDVAHWLIRQIKVDEVIAIARRGPAEVKFTRKEMESIAANLNLEDLETEFERVKPVMESLGQEVEAAKAYILAALPKAVPPVSDTRFRFEFLASPARIIGGEQGLVRGLEIEDTTLVPGENGPKAKRLGTTRMIPVDTVIFCIGDRVDESLGLPVQKNEFVKNPHPQFPVNGLSYEAYNPSLDRPVDRVFVAGWAREASSGLVGIARRDGENGARAVLRYLETTPPVVTDEVLKELEKRLRSLGKAVITKEDVVRLVELERCEAQRLGLEDFKFKSNSEMLAAIKKVIEA